MYKVSRFIDPTNLTEFFEAAVRQEQTVTDRSHQINKVHYGRLQASAYFFRNPTLKGNKKLWESLRQISETYRNYLSQKVSLEVLTRELRNSEDKTKALIVTLDDLISKCAFTYTTAENPQISADMIINGAAEVTNEVRSLIIMNSKL